MEIIKKEEIELLKKINTLRKEVKDNLTKSGNNNFAHYTYFQLDDFLPQLIDTCAKKQELFINFNIDKEKVDLPTKIITTPTSDNQIITTQENNFEYREYAYLTVIDLSSGVSKVYKKETKDATVSGATAIQNLGAKSTYMKRYLYMDLLELAEDDQVDSDNNNTNSEAPKATTTPTPKVETKKTESKKATTTEETKPVEKVSEGDELMSLADKEEITKFILENKLEPVIIVEISQKLGYSSPVELRAKDKEAVMTAIKEKVGK